MIKKILALLMSFLFVLAPLSLQAEAADDTVTINLYNWGQYLSDGTDGSIDVIGEFEKKYPNIKVNHMTFDSNESMYTKLVSGGSSYDIILPSDYMIEKLIAEDMLEPLNYENIPNFRYVDEIFRDPAYDPGSVYSVPYTWGSVGIIYNIKFVEEADIGSWDLLWNEKYAGKILMFDNCRDAFAISELLLGYDLNTQDTEELDASADLLRKQTHLVQNYVMDQIFDKMQRAEAWIAPYYAGDYLTMVEVNPDLGFYLPKEGFNLFVDGICIPKGCQHKKEAELFINFLLDPEICGKNLEYLGYSSPETASREYMDPDYANNPIAYPSAEVQEMGRSFTALSLESNQYMNALWLTVKTADSSTTVYLILTIAAIVLILFFWIFFKVRKKRAKARRCRKWKQPE